jgi:hypothetical protein
VFCSGSVPTSHLYKIAGIRLCTEGSHFIGHYKSYYHFGPSEDEPCEFLYDRRFAQQSSGRLQSSGMSRFVVGLVAPDLQMIELHLPSG